MRGGGGGDGGGWDREAVKLWTRSLISFLSFSTGRHPSWHQVGFDSTGRRWTCEALRFWFLCAGIAGAAQAQVIGGHTILDVTGGYITSALWPWGGHLVAGHYGHRDGRWRTAVLQWATAAGDATHTGHAAAKSKECPQSIAASAIVSGSDASARSSPACHSSWAVGASVSAASGTAIVAGAANA